MSLRKEIKDKQSGELITVQLNRSFTRPLKSSLAVELAVQPAALVLGSLEFRNLLERVGRRPSDWRRHQHLLTQC